MRNLNEYINESIFDMDEESLNYASSDLMDMYNSQSEEEFIERWKFLKLRLINKAEVVPKDQHGYLQKKQGRVYIRLYQVSYDHSIYAIHFGKDTNGYILGWNRKANKVVLDQNRYINFRNSNLNDREFKEQPLYILPNDLRKSYRELIKIA